MNQRRWVYRCVLAVARFFVALLFPLRVTGLENLPLEGRAVLCANHIANLDPVLLACAAKARDVRFMAKAELLKFKPLAGFWLAVGVIPVRRGESDMGALRQSMQVLKDGHVLGIFAQGHRDPTGELAMESGVALLALRTQSPVIPVFVAGPYRPFRRFPIVVGPPVDLSNFGGKYDSELLRAATREIQSAVRALDPRITTADK